MRSRKSPDRVMTLALLFFVVAAGCVQEPQPPPEGQEILKTLEQGVATREAIEEELNAMDVPQLIDLLEADSRRGYEPFNSLAYRELTTRGPKVGEELASRIKSPDRTSFLTLIALREVNRDLYSAVKPNLGLAILLDTLRTSEFFNAWGLPHLYWEDAALAVIEYGREAIEPLHPFLKDDRPAQVWGSEEVMESDRYQYRVKDYAWAMLIEVRGERIEIPVDPITRDKLILLELER